MRLAGFLAACAGGLAVTACATQEARPFALSEPSLTTSLPGAFLAGRYAEISGDETAARMFLREALKRDPTDPSLLERGHDLALKEANVRLAAEFARRRAVLVDVDDKTAMTLAVDAFVRGRTRDARGLLTQDVAFNAFAAVAAEIVQAWTYAADGDHETAVAFAETSERLGYLPDLRALTLGLLRHGAGEETAAAAAFAKAAEGPGVRDFTVVDAYGRLLERTGRADEAEALYLRALREEPAHVIAQAGLARLRAGATPEPYPSDARRGAAVGLQGLSLRLARRRFPNAVNYASYAVALDPDYGEAWSLLGEIFSVRGDDELAAAAYGKVPEGDPAAATARLAEARAHFRAENLPRALAALRALEGGPFQEDARLFRTQFLHQSGRFEDALTLYDGLIADRGDVEDGRVADLLYARANAQIQLGAWDAAVADLERALKIRPEDPRTLNDLGYVLIDREIDLGRGVAYAERALEQDPDNAAYLDTLGWGRFREGAYDEAVALLERAVEGDPASVLLLDHLGDAYWRAGRKREARYQWRHALDAEPDPAEVPRLEAKIADGLDHGLPTDVAAADALTDGP